MEQAIWMRASVAVVTAAAAAMMVGCAPQPSSAPVVIKDKVYSVTPDAIKVKAGMVTGEVTEMKVTERVEAGSGKVTSPAKLSGKLVLKNVSSDQTLRMVGGKILYIDSQGKQIKMEDNRSDPTLKVSSPYGAPERIDPGQDATQAVDADFPVEALKAKRLKEIRLELTYIPSPFKEETMNFAVSIGVPKQ